MIGLPGLIDGIRHPPKQQPNNPPGNWFVSPYPVAPIDRKPAKQKPFPLPPLDFRHYGEDKKRLPRLPDIIDKPTIDYPAAPPDSGYNPRIPFRGPFGIADPFSWEYYWRKMRKRPAFGRIGGGGKRRKIFRRRRGGMSAVTKYINKGMVYRRRPMPRYRRRRYVKRIRFVKRVINSTLAARTHLFTRGGTCTTTATATTCQGFMLFSLYGMNGAAGVTSGLIANVGDGDMFAVYSDTVTDVTKSSLVQIRGAVMDVTLLNLSSDFPVFCDIYKIICRRDVPLVTTSPTILSISQLFAVELTDAETVGANALGINTWPTTLFDNSGFCRYFKILSKTRSQIDPQAILQLQMKTHVQRQFTLEDIEDKVSRRGWTQSYVILFWGPPNVTAANFPFTASVSYTCARRYRASQLQGSTIGAGYEVLG